MNLVGDDLAGTCVVFLLNESIDIPATLRKLVTHKTWYEKCLDVEIQVALFASDNRDGGPS